MLALLLGPVVFLTDFMVFKKQRDVCKNTVPTYTLNGDLLQSRKTDAVLKANREHEANVQNGQSRSKRFLKVLPLTLLFPYGWLEVQTHSIMLFSRKQHLQSIVISASCALGAGNCSGVP